MSALYEEAVARLEGALAAAYADFQPGPYAKARALGVLGYLRVKVSWRCTRRRSLGSRALSRPPAPTSSRGRTPRRAQPLNPEPWKP